MKDVFAARYKKDGIIRSYLFDSAAFNKESASERLNEMGVKNFFFVFDPSPPVNIDDNTVLFSGDVGFDITLATLLPSLQAGKSIVLDSYGGDLWEGLKIHDAIKSMDIDVDMGVLGSCMSAATLLLAAASKRWATPNSRLLIHNAWMQTIGDSEEHQKQANLLKAENEGAAKIYAQLTGGTVIEMLALMDEERIMYADEMLERGFISEIKQQIQNEMTNNGLDEKLKAHEDSIMQRIQNFFKGGTPAPVKNAILQDVTGAEFDFGDSVETIDDVEIGTTATVGGSPAVGEYVFANGKTYVFEAGAVTQIIDPAEEAEALKTENTELAGQLAAAQTEIQNKAKELKTLRAHYEGKLNAIKNEFSALKNQYNPEPPTAPGAPAGDPAEGGKRFIYKGKK